MKILRFCLSRWRILKCKLLSDGPQIQGKPLLYQPLLTKGEGKISFGNKVQIGVIASPQFFSGYCYLEARNGDSKIIIGNNVAFNNSFAAVAFSEISIGDNVLFGINCSVIDNDGHDLSPGNRYGNPKQAAVTIERNVFIGNNVAILKGVTIGENAVIGNGSVVVSDIPANVIAAGNPAKVIRSL